MEAKNPYYLKDNDGGYYNKYPEFQIWEEGFKAGKQEGIREVVEWIKAYANLEHGDRDAGLCFEDYLHFEYAEWQAKLKSWGIK